MERRSFLKSTLMASSGVAVIGLVEDSRVEGATAANQSILSGSPVIFGPDSDALCILQSVSGPATGYAEIAVNGEPFRRIDAETSGLLPYDPHALKFRLPPIPPGVTLQYRVTVRRIRFEDAYHIFPEETGTSQTHSVRTLDPSAKETRFIVWNDTHENLETIRALHEQTVAYRPDFLLWNGDQTNDIYEDARIKGQILSPGGLAIAADWPLAYLRGNHDVRGPAARHLPRFTGTPGDRFYSAFRSGPLAVLMMDTGEDKPDDHPVFGGLAAFQPMRRRQTEWLAGVIRELWFREAPFRVLFCHIPLWWSDEATDFGHWRFSKVCREAWLPLLVEAGVKLVVSGHTHEHAWLSAGADRAIGQLIGGGPKPQDATMIEGVATARRLTMTMKTLDGAVAQQVEVDAVN
jgi:acid phosphatase type 7